MSIENLDLLEKGGIMPIFEINGFRKARLLARLTQVQAAAKIGVDPITIIQWEKGTNTPTKRNLEKTAEVYGCSVNELLSDNPGPKQDGATAP